MTTTTAGLTAAAFATGLVLTAALSRRSYRKDGEPHRSHRSPWWIAPVLASATYLVLSRISAGPVAVWGVITAYLACLAWLCAVDLDVHRLPDRLTMPLMVLVPAAFAAICAAGGSWHDEVRAIECGAALTAGFAVLFLTAGGGLGLGDVKLAASIGTVAGWFSWMALLVTVYATVLTAAVYACGLLVTRRGSRTSRFAYGPFMALGLVLALALAT